MQSPFDPIKAVATLAVAGFLAGGLASPVSAAPPDAAQDVAVAAMDPTALSALDRMGQYLSSLTTFKLTADTTMAVTLDGGHPVQVEGTVHYWVREPDRIRIDSESDMVFRQFFYDGETFTLVAPVDGYYARTPAGPTIAGTLAMAAESLNVEIPLAKLMDWTTDRAPLKLFQRGTYVGSDTIGGITTTHVALSGKALDFEVWIPDGDTPLPLQMAVVDHKAPGSPRFTARLSWTPEATIADDIFVFTPGKETRRVNFAEAAPAHGMPTSPPNGQGGQ